MGGAASPGSPARVGAGRAGCRQPVCLRKGGSECEMSQAPGRGAELSPLRSQSHSRRIPPSPTSTFDRQHKSPKGALTGSRPREGERLASSKRQHVLRASLSTGRDEARVNAQLLGLGVRVCAALHRSDWQEKAGIHLSPVLWCFQHRHCLGTHLGVLFLDSGMCTRGAQR